MIGKRLMSGVAILLALAVNSADAEYDVGKYCQLVELGTKLPSFDSCQTYYICQDQTYTKESCPGTESFDKDSQSCKPSSSVKCYYGVSDPCAISSETFVPDPKNCNGYIYCKDHVNAGSGTCPDKQIFQASTGSCVYGTCTNNDGNTIVPVDNVCDIMPNGAFFGDFEACDAWFKCNNGKKQPGVCNPGLVYNTQKGMCLKDTDNTMCNRIENPPPSDPCGEDQKNTSKGDNKICSVYYKCDGSKWVKETCTNGQYFDVNTEKCVDRQAAAATEGCDRCEFSTSSYVNAVDEKCQEYLICINGVKYKDTYNCSDPYYFNEQRQACVSNATLSGYRENNGACHIAGGDAQIHQPGNNSGSNVDGSNES